MELAVDLDCIKAVADKLLLEEDDLIGGVVHPQKDCKCCGGFGVAGWEEDGSSIPCDCILRNINPDNADDINITWKWLRFILTITKEDVYGTKD